MTSTFQGQVAEYTKCHTCGKFQLPENGLRCSRCDAVLLTPLRVYRRTWQGDLEPVESLDLTPLLPPSRPSRSGLLVQGWVAVLVVMLLSGGVLFARFWNSTRVLSQQQAGLAGSKRDAANQVVEIKASARWAADGGLVVAGDTNLPEGTRLDVRVNQSGTTLARSFPVTIWKGAFQSPVLRNRGGAFRPGDYQIKVLARFAPGEQDAEVFDNAGPQGRNLIGPFVAPRPEDPRGREVSFLQGFELHY